MISAIDALNIARKEQLSLAAIQAALLIAENGATKLSDLARQMGITSAAMTAAADALEYKELASRKPTSDRRVHFLDLDPEFLKRLQHLPPAVE